MVPIKSTSPATPAAAAENGAGVAADPATRRAFFQHPFVQKVLPFLTSVSLHLGILMIGFLAFTAIKIIREPARQHLPLPDSIEIQDNPIQGIPGFSDDKPWLRTAQDQVVVEDAGADATVFHNKKLDLAGGGGASDATVISVGADAAFGHGTSNGLGTGPKTGHGSGEGAPPPFGIPGLGGVRSAVFVTDKIPARKIAFVCDASGSMINKMPSLKLELIKAVSKLKPIQSFSLIFFQDAHLPILLDQSLVMATPQNKRRAQNFLESVTTFGTTDPIPGIEAAFRQQPELIYLLTDGDFPDNDAVLTRIRDLNKGKNIRVNTIAFVGTGDTDTAFIDLLKKVAAETHGTYQHVSEEELQ